MITTHAPVMTAFEHSDLQRLVDAQCGMVTQPQVKVLGYGRGRVRHLLDTGRWRRVLQGVYAVTNGPLTREMTLSAALLYGGDHAMLSHRTAVEEWGMFEVDETVPVHVTVPYGKSSRPQAATETLPARASTHPVLRPGSLLHPGVVVHRSRAHRHIGVDAMRPRTSKADTALDVAIAESSARQAYVSLITTVTNSRIRLADIRQRMNERRPRRYRRALDSAVALLADGVQSVLEYHYAVDVEQAHGLPPARRQGPVIVDGRTLYEDVDYSGCGVPLIVRLDGRWAHSMREVQFRDRRRDNAAELADRPRLVYGMDEVGGMPCVVAQEVESVLTREGWRRDYAGRCRACAPFR
ncbi:hypothetical protein GCM10027068_08000 [Prescottella soli]